MFHERGMSDEPDDRIEYLKHENARAKSAFARAKTIHCMERLQYLYSFVKSELTRLVPKWRNRCAEVLKIPRGGIQTPTRGHWTERGINEIKSL